MTTDLFPDATREAGLNRLKAFAPRMGRAYASGRNADPGADALLDSDQSAVSLLSPFIRHRLISEREAVETALARFSYSSAEKFIQEVCWRTYWKGWLELRPSVWRDYCAERDQHLARLADDGALRAAYDRAIGGQTGIDCFDQWVGDLIATGYLHNHARMWFASIWVYSLRLPWALGADLFMRHLADADAASNTLSWRWVCGLQTKGKTYLARASNIARYTDGRFNPVGQLANDAPQLDGPQHPPVTPLAPERALPEGRIGILITDEDCHPSDALGAGREVTAMATLSTVNVRSPSGAGEVATRFAAGALEDAARRTAAKWTVDADRIHPDQLSGWMKDKGLDAVVTPWIPTGPTRDAVLATGVPVVERRRMWDNVFWPCATRGFFPFKEKIPRALADLGLTATPPKIKAPKKRAHH